MLPSHLSDLYRPVILVHSSTDVDTIIRTHYSNQSQHQSFDGIISLLQTRAKSLRFFKPHAIRPPVWSDAISKLEDALPNDAVVAHELVHNFQEALHSCTLGAPHDFLNGPLLKISVYWVGQDILDYNDAHSDNNSNNMGDAGCNNNAEHHIILVMRSGKKQDEAAYENALKSSHNLVDNLNTTADESSVTSTSNTNANAGSTAEAVCKGLMLVVKNYLSKHISILSEQHARLRRARGSTFSSWFRGTPIVEPSVNNDSLDSRSTTPANSAPTSPMDPIDRNALDLPIPPPALPKKRRVTFGGDADDTPLFPSDSYESCARNLADYLLLQGKITDALEIYRALAIDFKVLTGPARIHEAAVHEMIGIGTTLVSNGPNGEILRSAETAVSAYMAAERPELAVRVALRLPGVHALIKTVNLLRLERIPGSFLDMSAGVLHTKTALELMRKKKHRKASLHAFLAVTKFTKISMRRPAAIAIKLVHPTALKWNGIQDEVDIVSGMAELDNAGKSKPNGNTARNAVSHFINVLANSDDSADVEVQSFIVRQLANAVGKGAVKTMNKSWRDGAKFPKIVEENTTVETMKITASDNASDNSGYTARDSKDDDGTDANDRLEEIRKGEDEVLCDFEYFEEVRKNLRENKSLPKREKKLSDVIQEMRNSKDNLGGSLENKIRRMKERHASVRKRRRARSLLDGCAVVGEIINVTVALRNPLHFPVFVNDMSAVVTLDGELYTQKNNDGAIVEFIQREEVVLGPRSVENIRLQLIAKQTGILRCVGAQWKFTIGMGDSKTRAASQIPGTAIIERRGKRLNNTQRERASIYPLYEVDTSLQVEVTQQTPRITISGDNMDLNTGIGETGWKAGEIRRIQLTLNNIGGVNGDGVIFRIHTADSVRFEMPDSNDTLTCKENGDAVVAGYLPVVIPPGESVPVWIWIRASGDLKPQKKKTNVPQSVQCKCALSIAYGTNRARVARWETSFEVTPSIYISRRFLLPNNNNSALNGIGNKGFLLGVEVEHSAHIAGDVPCYNVEWFSNTSKNGWMVLQLPDTEKPNDIQQKLIDIPSVDNDGRTENKMAALRVNETATLFAVLHKEYDGDSHEDTKKKEWKTTTVAFDNDDEIDGEFRRSVQHYVLTATEKKGKYAKVRETGALIAVVWKNAGRNGNRNRGALFLSPIDVERYALVALDNNHTNNNGSKASSTINTRSSSLTSLSLPTTPRAPISADAITAQMQNMKIIGDEEDSPVVKLSLKHPEIVSADFSSQSMGLACVPVDLFVRNVSKYLVDVFVTAASHDEIADGARGRYWTGDTSMSLRAIPPDAERYLQLTAVIDTPGKYDMAHINVKYQLKKRNTKSTNRDLSNKKISVRLDNSFVNVVHQATSGNLPELDDLVNMSSGEISEVHTDTKKMKKVDTM